MAGSIPRREQVMRHALGDARRTLTRRAEHRDRSCEDDMAEIGRAIGSDDVSGAIDASERAERPGALDFVDGRQAPQDLTSQGLKAQDVKEQDLQEQDLQEQDLQEVESRKRRRSRTATVDDIRRELSRRDRDDEP